MPTIHFTSPVLLWISNQDIAYHDLLAAGRTESHNMIMLFITRIGDPVSLLLISIFVLGILWLLKRPLSIIHLSVSMVIASGAVIILKHLFGRIRPVGLIAENGYSFPSGHALVSAVFFPLVHYIFKEYFKSGWQRALFSILIFGFMIAIMWSRLYLGVHYISDVLGGLLIGLSITAISIIINEGYARKLKK